MGRAVLKTPGECAAPQAAGDARFTLLHLWGEGDTSPVSAHRQWAQAAEPRWEGSVVPTAPGAAAQAAFCTAAVPHGFCWF